LGTISRRHDKIHIWNCKNIRDIVNLSRITLTICSKIVKAAFLRVTKILIHNNIQCDHYETDKLMITNGRYQQINLIKSKEFRLSLSHPQKQIALKYINDLDELTMNEYMSQINKLNHTRHKNTLLRIWNGDCLSYSRLLYLKVTTSNACSNCSLCDSPVHMLVECTKACQVWEQLMQKLKRDMAKLCCNMC
jgi:hypothetical protein